MTSQNNQDSAQALLTEHNYDGIQEYDNPTPGWWWWLFHATVIFSIPYFIFFTLSPASWTLREAHDAGLAQLMMKKFGDLKLTPDAATILKYSRDEQWLSVGKATFAGKCSVCHSADGAGINGPNLTDDYYKNVKKIDDIATVVANGAANGAMPSWKNQLHPNEIVLVSAYVASLRGKNLPGPRGVEGEQIAPWPAPPAEAAAPDTDKTQDSAKSKQ